MYLHTRATLLIKRIRPIRNLGRWRGGPPRQAPLRSIALLIALIAHCALLGAPPLSRSAAATDAPALVLGVGDSLMYGIGASLPDERGEFALFADLARGRFGPNVRAVNVSVPGETSASLLAPKQPPVQIDGARTELGRVPEGQSAIVLLSIGGNDLLAVQGKDTSAREAALGAFRTNLDTVLARLLDGGRARQILIPTIYNPRGGDPTIVGSDAWWVERFNAALREVAAAHPGTVVADLSGPVRGKEDALTLARYGDVHLSNAGHRLAADILWTASGLDTTPPKIALVSPSPTDGASLRPIVTVRATITDDSGPNGVSRVVILVDGKEGDELLPRPDLGADTYLGVWDGRAFPGTHTLGIAAADRAGNYGAGTVRLVVGATP